MIDLARRRGLSFDLARLARALGAPVVPVAARSGEGVDELSRALRALARRADRRPAPAARRRDRAPAATSSSDWAERVVAESVGGAHALGGGGDTLLDRLDVTFTHPIAGLLVFLGVMAGLFWTIFALATVPMDLIEATFAHLGGFLEAQPAGRRGARPPGRRPDRRRLGHGRLPAADLPALLPDHAARGHRLPGARGVRHGPPALPLRPARLRLRAAALEPRLRHPGHPRRAADPGPPRPLRHHPGGAVHELLGAPAGLRAADQLPVRRTGRCLAGLAFAGCYLLGAIAALAQRLPRRRTLLPGALAADGARAADATSGRRCASPSRRRSSRAGRS